MAPSGRGAAAGCRVILLVRDVQTPRTVFVYQKEAETEQCVTHPKIKQLNYFTVYILSHKIRTPLPCEPNENFSPPLLAMMAEESWGGA